MKKIVIFLMALLTMTASYAQKSKANVKTKKVQVVSDIVDAHGMYVYGVAFSPVDSVVYITDEQELDGAQMHLRTKFIVGRDELSKQLQRQMMLEGEKNFSCCVVYSQDIKKLDKKYQKQISYYKKRGFTVNQLSRDRFLFKAVRREYTEGGYATEEIEVPVEE
jgi:hypothetical protein